MCVLNSEWIHAYHIVSMPNHTPYLYCILLYTINKHHNNIKSGNKSKMFYHERGNTVILNIHTIIELKLICWLHNFQQPHATCHMPHENDFLNICPLNIWCSQFPFEWIWNLNRSLVLNVLCSCRLLIRRI